MPRKSLAVVVAMARELAPMLRGMRSERVDGIDFFELPDIAVAVGGIGRKAASRTAEGAILPEFLFLPGWSER